MAIYQLQDLKDKLGIREKSGVSDIKEIIHRFLDRENIDLISRIDRNELDKICNMLHHSHQISLKWNKALLEKYKSENNQEKIKELTENSIMCSGELYVLQNLGLRLSLGSESRKELENVFISLIKTELDIMKNAKEDTSQKKPEVS